MIDYYNPNINLTLYGCGFLGTYHTGAIYLLTQIWPQKPFNRICGASCGGLLGALLIVGLRMESVLDNMMNIIEQLQRNIWNPSKFISVRHIVEQNLERLLPQDAHKSCSQRLGLSLTKLWSFENIFVTEFETRQDLIDAVVAGCFIPIWSGTFSAPKFRGQSCIDGAYTCNTPKFDLKLEERQIDVCPIAGEIDGVSPDDSWNLGKISVMGTKYYVNWNNFVRSHLTIFPCNASSYKHYIIGGYKDMKNYLLNNRMIKCKICYLRNNSVKEEIGNYACIHCLKLMEKVDALQLPPDILKIMDR